MPLSRVAPPAAPVVETTTGSLRALFTTAEKALRIEEAKEMAAATSDAERASLKADFQAERKARGEKFATMLMSQKGWRTKPGCNAQAQVLCAFYRIVGQRARELAASEGKPFSMAYVDRVRLTRADVESVRKQFGDKETKVALGLLKRHIMSGSFLTDDARQFMVSAQFLSFQVAIEQSRDKVEHGVRAHDDALAAETAQLVRDERKASERRQLLHWSDPHLLVTRTADGKREAAKCIVVGGRLVVVSTFKE